MTRLASLAIAAAGLGAGLGLGPGCGADGIDLTGTYEVVDHRANAAGCTGLAPTSDPPYIRFTSGDLVGQTYFSIAACATADAVECPGVIGFPYFDPIDSGWRAEVGTAQTTGGCILDYARSDAILDAGGYVVIDTFTYRDDSVRPDDECTAERAVDLGDDMPCVTAEHLEAIRL